MSQIKVLRTVCDWCGSSVDTDVSLLMSHIRLMPEGWTRYARHSQEGQTARTEDVCSECTKKCGRTKT